MSSIVVIFETVVVIVVVGIVVVVIVVGRFGVFYISSVYVRCLLPTEPDLWIIVLRGSLWWREEDCYVHPTALGVSVWLDGSPRPCTTTRWATTPIADRTCVFDFSSLARHGRTRRRGVRSSPRRDRSQRTPLPFLEYCVTQNPTMYAANMRNQTISTVSVRATQTTKQVEQKFTSSQRNQPGTKHFPTHCAVSSYVWYAHGARTHPDEPSSHLRIYFIHPSRLRVDTYDDEFYSVLFFGLY